MPKKINAGVITHPLTFALPDLKIEPWKAPRPFITQPIQFTR
jgi:hypothetical protein